MTKDKTQMTPLMEQYYSIKVQYEGILLLFQVGDFYELFFEDAKTASSFLGITLTKRGNVNGEPIPLCGVPVHAKDHYVRKLVRGGFKVALCDQLEEPKPGTIVKRGVTQVLTPGTLTDDNLLDTKTASYLFSFFPLENECGLLFGELLTAQLFATTVPVDSQKMLEAELIRFFPDEILLPNTESAKKFHTFFKQQGYITTTVNSYESSIDAWLHQMNDGTEQSITSSDAIYHAMKMFYSYLDKNQRAALGQFKSIHFYQAEDFLILDAATQQALDIVKNSTDQTKNNTLFAVLDCAITAMGSRMIKKWLLRPLVNNIAIEQRFDAIDFFMAAPTIMHECEQILSAIGDIERVIGRIALTRATINDYRALGHALGAVPHVKELLKKSSSLLLAIINEHIANFSTLYALLNASINDDFSISWLIKKGFSEQLDRLRDLIEHGSSAIIELEKKEQQATGIGSLKIRYNKLHGYYIEVTKPNMHLVPSHYIQQHSLVGRMRFVTKELQRLQHDLFTARNEVDYVEKEVFESIQKEVASYSTLLRKLAYALAQTDALVGFARAAHSNNYVRPLLNTERMIIIQQGRHPVVEKSQEHTFIPNDTRLDDQQALWIITGPNMGGKSTYLRQVAHIALMTHVGSFVPAQHATISMLDRIFTRIGASDNLAAGKSTFLVEMEEVASICLHATKNSLVILDEVGRGTSTFDGLAIAQAVVEHIYTTVQARCLFATHYHELTALHESYSGIVNYYAASKKTVTGIIFLYKIIAGIADGSFGIEVAKLARLPKQVVARAQDILAALTQHEQLTLPLAEQKLINNSYQDPTYSRIVEEMNAENTALKNKLKKLENIDYDTLSPKKAFDILWSLSEQS